MFIGPKEIKNAEVLVEKYGGDIEMTKVTYVDGSVETMPSKLYGVSTSEAATDLTTLRQNRLHPVVAQILELLLSWGVSLSDVNFIGNSIGMSVNNSINAANTKLWGKAETDLNLIDVDAVLKQKVTLKDILPSPPPADGDPNPPQPPTDTPPQNSNPTA